MNHFELVICELTEWAWTTIAFDLYTLVQWFSIFNPGVQFAICYAPQAWSLTNGQVRIRTFLGTFLLNGTFISFVTFIVQRCILSSVWIYKINVLPFIPIWSDHLGNNLFISSFTILLICLRPFSDGDHLCFPFVLWNLNILHSSLNDYSIDTCSFGLLKV